MKGRVQRRDGELIVILPEDEAKAEGLGEDIEVVIRPTYPIDTMTFQKMIERITPESRHGETDWGSDVGNEIVEW
jgi:antitoxin component of MazEF toxin-antitoxin module